MMVKFDWIILCIEQRTFYVESDGKDTGPTVEGVIVRPELRRLVKLG